MKETSRNGTYTDRIRSWATTKAHGGTHRSARRSVTDTTPIPTHSAPSPHPTSNTTTPSTSNNAVPGSSGCNAGAAGIRSAPGGGGSAADLAADGSSPQPAKASPQDPGPGAVVEPPEGADPEDKNNNKKKKMQNVAVRFLLATKTILLYSKLNLALVFVPVGIIAKELHLAPGIVFAMNAIAIIPLAGLLSYATETVARRLGDTIGALLNVTFGNAVELIIFIALVKNEIRIVQASLLGSILANLLLILGMSFLLGGLRFREQIYNSTVTQMSACLLSLSVISLVLPTAFHASFSDVKLADERSLTISRGTSVVLLLVYIIYLFFQLKSHAYMYESTPQYIIDEEATPGPVAGWLDSSSSDGSSSDSSDSDGSGHSRDTVSKRVKRVIRGGRKRKQSIISMDTGETFPTRTSSFGTADLSHANDELPSEESSAHPPMFSRSTTLQGSDEAVDDDKPHQTGGRRHRRSLRRHRKNKKEKINTGALDFGPSGETIDETPEALAKSGLANGEPRRVDFALTDATSEGYGATEVLATRLPFTTGLRNISLGPVAKSFAPTVFVQSAELAAPPVPTGRVPRVRYGIRRTNSLPDRLNQMYRPPGAMMPSQIPLTSLTSGAAAQNAKTEEHDDLSRTSAILLLVVTTGLVALCADFMVESIDGLVQSSTISEIFIGLIILPIVGNAAEHVTAITVAMKNKMDLSIGVAVGSSIQIALFITPLVVILGWIMDREMTLYFTLFETVCLFVSTFIVNFLVLDGRSNYLEGALLCATYVIISLVAFYYPNPRDASVWGA